MKILYISTPFFADCDFPLIKSLQAKGVNITYLILLAPYSLRSTLIDIKEQINDTAIFPATRYPELKVYEQYMDMSKVYVANRTSSKSYSLSYWKLNWLINKFIKKGQYDIIHSDTLIGKMQGFMYRNVKHWIQTIHDPFPHTGESSKKKINRYRYVIGKSKKIILLNENQLEKFCSQYCVEKKNVFTNRLGVYDNIRTFVNPKMKEQPQNILFFGRISPYKGIEYLCEAMTIVHEALPEATLTIAGGGKLYFDTTKYDKLPYISITNRYIGMEELASLLTRCVVTVCPYTDATQSGVIMTSYSLCKPVVATNVGGLGEMVDNGHTGLLVPPKNAKALAEAIIEILADDNKCLQMKENIRNDYFINEKSWNCIADKYISIYKDTLQ